MGSLRRAARVVAIAALAAAAVPTGPPAALADGGAYVWFERTYNYPGTQAEGYASVYLPKPKRELLDRGPFYLYLITGKRPIVEQEPLPAGAIRLGAFSTELKRDWYEFEVGFTVPEVPGGFYTVMVCNDPCTVSGFREPLVGVLPIVATAREERLLRQQGRLQGTIGRLRRDLRKAERAFEDLEGAADLRSAERIALIADVSELRSQAERLRVRLATRPRPVVSDVVGWAGAAGLVLVAAALLLRRRGRGRGRSGAGALGADPAGLAVPDTLAALDLEEEHVVGIEPERERAGTR